MSLLHPYLNGRQLKNTSANIYSADWHDQSFSHRAVMNVGDAESSGKLFVICGGGECPLIHIGLMYKTTCMSMCGLAFCLGCLSLVFEVNRMITDLVKRITCVIYNKRIKPYRISCYGWWMEEYIKSYSVTWRKCWLELHVKTATPYARRSTARLQSSGFCAAVFLHGEEQLQVRCELSQSHRWPPSSLHMKIYTFRNNLILGSFYPFCAT